MNTSIRKAFSLMAVLFASLLTALAHAASYNFIKVDYPGADATQLWGVNNAGRVVGEAFFGADVVNFVYEIKGGSFTVVAQASTGNVGLLGINNPGVMVGNGFNDPSATNEIGVIRGKDGSYATVSRPDWPNVEFRAINESGFITGWAFDDTQSTGFVYDSKRHVFTDFLPSVATIAQGISSRGEIVGSTIQPNGRYGFVRAADGGLTLFQVNGRPTRARGITDSGTVCGIVTTTGGTNATFVGSLTGMSFEILVVPWGAVNTFAEGMNNDGVIVGQADASGFIAIPAPKGKK